MARGGATASRNLRDSLVTRETNQGQAVGGGIVTAALNASMDEAKRSLAASQDGLHAICSNVKKVRARCCLLRRSPPVSAQNPSLFYFPTFFFSPPRARALSKNHAADTRATHARRLSHLPLFCRRRRCRRRASLPRIGTFKISERSSHFSQAISGELFLFFFSLHTPQSCASMFAPHFHYLCVLKRSSSSSFSRALFVTSQQRRLRLAAGTSRRRRRRCRRRKQPRSSTRGGGYLRCVRPRGGAHRDTSTPREYRHQTFRRRG